MLIPIIIVGAIAYKYRQPLIYAGANVINKVGAKFKTPPKNPPTVK